MENLSRQIFEATDQNEGSNDRVVVARDLTERLNYINIIEEQNKKLNEIAWMLSHMVRAPLARIMGLVNLINDFEQDDIEKQKILGYITLSANELDVAIRKISAKAEIASY